MARRQEEALCDWIPSTVQAYCTVRPVVRRGHAAEEILKMAAEGSADLLVIGAQHRPLLETTIFGTTSIRVIRHAPVPVLAVVGR